MKKKFAILLALVLMFTVFTVAYAGHYIDVRCESEKCDGSLECHGCGQEEKTKTPVECPDNIVNCECYFVETVHYFVCMRCSNVITISTYSYQHSK